MLAKRSIALGAGTLVPEPILRHEHIAQSVLARELLADTQKRCQQQVAEQAREMQALQQQALADFWGQANGLLEGLRLHGAVLEQQMMEAIGAVLNQALAQLLDSATLAERVRAVLRHLAGNAPEAGTAVLEAHPDALETVAQWLEQSGFAGHWQLKAAPGLLADEVRLSHPAGTFELQWLGLREGLLAM